MDEPTDTNRSFGRISSVTSLLIALGLPGAAFSLSPVALAQHAPVYACSLTRDDLDGRVLAHRDAMSDATAPLVHAAQFTPDGFILGVDRIAKQVLLLDRDLDVVRVIGGEGKGPGEYEHPVAATMDEQGRVFVADSGGQGSILVFEKDGSYVQEHTLPLFPNDLTTDGSLIYLSSSVINPGVLARETRNWMQRPALVAYDPGTGSSEVLLDVDESWAGTRPLYWNTQADLIPRMGLDGHLYVGFARAYEIWRVTGANAYEVVVQGCLPRDALDLFRAEVTPAGQPRRGVLVLADFMVFEDGRVLAVNALYVDRTRKRSQDLFSPTGDRLRSWSLGPASALSLSSVMDPLDPGLRFTWFDGTNRLVRFPDFIR